MSNDSAMTILQMDREFTAASFEGLHASYFSCEATFIWAGGYSLYGQLQKANFFLFSISSSSLMSNDSAMTILQMDREFTAASFEGLHAS